MRARAPCPLRRRRDGRAQGRHTGAPARLPPHVRRDQSRVDCRLIGGTLRDGHREHAEHHFVNQPGFSRLELLHPETDGDYLLLAYWDSESAFDRWTTTNDVEAAHDELFGAMFLDPDSVDRDESATTIEAP